MSNFFTPTNEGRVQKMVDMVEGPLTKSANSNKATHEDWYTLFAPLFDALREVGLDIENVDQPTPATEPGEGATGRAAELIGRENQLRRAPDGTLREPSEGAPHSMTQYKPLWASVMDMAKEAPIEELGQAMVVYATRMDDMMHTCIDRQEKVSKTDPSPEPEVEEDDDGDAWD